jgi:cyclohexadienyl dehydratase
MRALVRLGACVLALGLGATPPSAPAAGLLQQVKSAGQLRVCIWPDYYGVTFRNPRDGQLRGIDIDLAAEFGKDLQVKIEHVDSSFSSLVGDLQAGRCEVAMFAVGILPQRAAHLKFTRPYLQSDVYGVTTRSSRVVSRWGDIDQPGVLVAVQAGTFMESVMAERLKHARLVVVRPPATRERELEAGRVDVFMTDYPYSRRLLDNADWATLIAPPTPFHVLPYAYAVKPGDDEWLSTVDAFVQRIQGDGRLDTAARRHGLGAIVVH